MRLIASLYSGHGHPGMPHAPSFISDELSLDAACASPVWWHLAHCMSHGTRRAY